MSFVLKTVHAVTRALVAVALFGTAHSVSAAEFEGKLVACLADGTNIGDVKSCGKIWKLASGDANLKPDGRLVVKVKGLVLNDVTVGKFNGTPDGVDAVAAAVICNGPSGAAVVAQTEPVPLSQSGDAKINVKISLPKGCVAPVIVLRERYEGKISGWLAATGL